MNTDTALHELPEAPTAQGFDGEVIDTSEKEDDQAPLAVRYAISSYGADYPVDSLVKRLRAGDIEIPEFQRGYVWTLAQASRFVESLLIGLPVPGIFLSRDTETQKLFVIDGQQRLLTLRYFYDGLLEGSEFKLKGVKEEFDGQSYKALEEEDRRRLDDAIIHATIVRQDDPENDQSSIYLVFERLNTGGTPLSPQEIRGCVYRGPFCDLIRDMNEFEPWRKLYGVRNKRGKDQELILRFLALYHDLDRYKRPMKVFLSDFMASNRHLERFRGAEMKRLFEMTVSFAVQAVGARGFRPEGVLNVAVTDALLVGTARRLSRGQITDAASYTAAFSSLVGDQQFLSKCRGGTTSEENVLGRITLASEAFGEIA